ncbi:MAG: hypothetical protein IPP28_00225 [Xanthomonadales bacterium]|nr:hypothetical protein [Xanthomonadales bacterium]
MEAFGELQAQRKRETYRCRDDASERKPLASRYGIAEGRIVEREQGLDLRFRARPHQTGTTAADRQKGQRPAFQKTLEGDAGIWLLGRQMRDDGAALVIAHIRSDTR